jgi:hypothetical protein
MVGLKDWIDRSGVYLGHRDQRQVEVADLVQCAVQRSLVYNLAGDHSFSGLRIADGEPVEPLRPIGIELTDDADGINSHDAPLRGFSRRCGLGLLRKARQPRRPEHRYDDEGSRSRKAGHQPERRDPVNAVRLNCSRGSASR